MIRTDSILLLGYFRFLAFFSLVCLAAHSIDAVELRATIQDSEKIRLILKNQQAVYKGDYAFTDYIYSDGNFDNLNDGYFRIRDYHITKWKQKAVAVIHKIRDPLQGDHRTQFKHECDSLEEAEKLVSANFHKKFSFSRRGWEYALNDLSIYVEEIDGLNPSVEVLGPSREKILELFQRLQVISIINDSVPEWYNKMENSKKS